MPPSIISIFVSYLLTNFAEMSNKFLTLTWHHQNSQGRRVGVHVIKYKIWKKKQEICIIIYVLGNDFEIQNDSAIHKYHCISLMNKKYISYRN